MDPVWVSRTGRDILWLNREAKGGKDPKEDRKKEMQINTVLL